MHGVNQPVNVINFEISRCTAGNRMYFEWDPNKATANLRKHGVSFEEATSALRDMLSATAHDPDHSDDEERFVTFGISFHGRLLAVSHTERGDAIRVVSARLATNLERRIYEEN